MLDELADERAIEELARSDVELACDRARSLVAARPADERAAALLKKVVQQTPRRNPLQGSRAPQIPPAVEQATTLIASGNLEEAEVLLRGHLKIVQSDPPAMHLMAEIAARCGFTESADRILRQSAHLHFNSPNAMADLGRTLHRIAAIRDAAEYVGESIQAFRRVIELDPNHEGALAYSAAMFVHERSLDDARRTFEQLVAAHPDVSEHWTNFGFLLKTIGEFGPAIAAYRTAIALDPANGTAWWGIANLKLGKFFADDIFEMIAALDLPSATESARVDIDFALAKALDDSKDYERAAYYLKEGNEVRARQQPPNGEIISHDVDFVTRFFTQEFFETRKGWGESTQGPIFIVGMPRAGSTLLEQILASHSAIEGTEELFILLKLAEQIAREHDGKQTEDVLRSFEKRDVADLGSRYLGLAQRYRRTGRPFFTDKNPSNWRYTSLIHCILPNARIIDVRRNPMDCCFANYRQHFQWGANFTYGQRELGRYYADYVRMMRHVDDVLPGRVYRLIYDDLVEDLEGEVRRLLDHLNLPFEENCLRYYDTERAVHTPSSEQVRQPINRSGFDRWRNYEPWLGELKEALGDVLTDWR